SVAMLPSDHYFSDDEAFARFVQSAFQAVEARPDLVILLGVVPDSVEVGYGWIEVGDRVAMEAAHAIHRGAAPMATSRCRMAQRTQSAARPRTRPNVPIQSEMARPISSGESSWRKWSPATFTSSCARNPRAKSRFAPPTTSKPGSAFTNSLGTWLFASQSA